MASVTASEESDQLSIEKFVEDTCTDVALAMYYLQNTGYDYKTAIKYFQSSEHQKVGDFTVPIGNSFSNDFEMFKVLSWNIDGTEPKEFILRMKKIVERITELEPAIIMFQELNEEALTYLENKLSKSYKTLTESIGKHYFCGFFIKNNVVIVEDTFEIMEFDKSTMERSVLSVEIVINTMRIKLLTSHLESTADFSEIRKSQLKEVFRKMNSRCEFCIFAGDLNLRDNEVNDVTIPRYTVDLWEYTGRRDIIKYTWDPRRNINASQMCGQAKPQRFDRMYFYHRIDSQSSDCDSITPVYFELEGLGKVTKGSRFPSDHWAILGHFKVIT